MASAETMRLLLQKTLERNDGLVKINHQSTLAIPTMLGVVWGIIAVIEKNSNAILIFALVTIGLLLLWRYVAHYIDDDISGNYSRIMQLEKELNVPQECSIYPGLIRTITKNFEHDKLLNDIHGLSIDQRIKLIEHLYVGKRLGYRGHYMWDMVAFTSIFLLIVISVSAAFQSIFNPVHLLHSQYLIALISLIKIAFFGFSLFIGALFTVFILIIFQNNVPMQKDPKHDELKKYVPIRI